MSDVIQRLPPMCPFCELFGRAPQRIHIGCDGEPSDIGGVPSCNDCAVDVTMQDMSADGVRHLVEMVESLRYLRKRGYTVTMDSGHWHAVKGSDAMHLSENDFIVVVKFKRFLEQRSKQEVNQ